MALALMVTLPFSKSLLQYLCSGPILTDVTSYVWSLSLSRNYNKLDRMRLIQAHQFLFSFRASSNVSVWYTLGLAVVDYRFIVAIRLVLSNLFNRVESHLASATVRCM